MVDGAGAAGHLARSAQRRAARVHMDDGLAPGLAAGEPGAGVAEVGAGDLAQADHAGPEGARGVEVARS